MSFYVPKKSMLNQAKGQGEYSLNYVKKNSYWPIQRLNVLWHNQ